jgi:hypothetical protein
MGTLANGMLAVDTSGDVTLFLDNAETSNSTGPALYLYEADVALVLADGSANVLQDGVAFDDPGAKSALFSNDALVLTGTGALSVNGVCGHGIASDDDVIIDVGQTTISAVTDGIHANDNITIRGGSVRVTGTNDGLESEGGLDCDQCEIALNGGIVVATSGDNSVPSGSSQQQVLVMGSVGVGTVILIESAEQDVLTFRVDKEYWSLIFTSPDLAANETYEIQSGATVSGGVEFHGLFFDATYSGGTVWNTLSSDDVVTYVGVTLGGPGQPRGHGGPGRPDPPQP